MNHTVDDRLALLHAWLQALATEHPLDTGSLQPASSDASFRRYFRIAMGDRTAIVMDAPPQHEDCGPFLHVTELLKETGVNVPAIIAQNLEQGFLLLSDLGIRNYYHAIQQGLSDPELQTRYRQAIAALVKIQSASTRGLPVYNYERLIQELELFPIWYAQRHCQASLSEADQATLSKTFSTLAHDNAAQDTVLVHRDFHSPNLMLCDQPAYGENPGIIDYQDALQGPITYDLASLVMDARTTWEEPQQLDWAIRYWEAARDAGLPVHHDFADFHRAYEWMSLQRNLRILGVFARLSHRDGKHHYLDHMPRVNAYVRQVASRYGVFTPLLRLLDRLDNRSVVVGYTF